MSEINYQEGHETAGQAKPVAFTTVGIAMAVALIVYSICRWG